MSNTHKKILINLVCATICLIGYMLPTRDILSAMCGIAAILNSLNGLRLIIELLKTPELPPVQ